ncbi:AraC-type DNA-binding protein [Pilibacter termitis]|uniref:AraC-type DNA-binding protein n=1 Tax=Pilibacter termitis TaxID=263852 RepID=A0A1T4LY81_9ENTE|nr:AraC family transcriptional regulator [Pilibacter termitis]SJZ59693.1 AraC-type DNA-binding protein [Pilibacter termitis]
MENTAILEYCKTLNHSLVYVLDVKKNKVLLNENNNKLMCELSKDDFFKHLLHSQVEQMKQNCFIGGKFEENLFLGENFSIFYDFLGLAYCSFAIPSKNLVFIIGAYRTNIKKISLRNKKLSRYLKLSKDILQVHFSEIKRIFIGIYNRILDCVFEHKKMIYLNLKSFLKNNIHQHYRLKELAELFFISPKTINRYSHLFDSKPFADCYNELKMEKAKEFILEGKNSLQEISQMVGYQEYSSFSRAFKLYFNCTPREFSKNMD